MHGCVYLRDSPTTVDSHLHTQTPVSIHNTPSFIIAQDLKVEAPNSHRQPSSGRVDHWPSGPIRSSHRMKDFNQEFPECGSGVGTHTSPVCFSLCSTVVGSFLLPWHASLGVTPDIFLLLSYKYVYVDMWYAEATAEGCEARSCS